MLLWVAIASLDWKQSWFQHHHFHIKAITSISLCACQKSAAFCFVLSTTQYRNLVPSHAKAPDEVSRWEELAHRTQAKQTKKQLEAARRCHEVHEDNSSRWHTSDIRNTPFKTKIHKERNRFGISVPSLMSMKPKCLIKRLTQDGMLSAWERLHCPHCSVGKVGSLRYFKDKKAWVHRCSRQAT